MPNSPIPIRTWWAKVVSILLISCAITLILLYGGMGCQYIADYLEVPIKWVVLAVVSLVVTLIVGPMQEVQ